MEKRKFKYFNFAFYIWHFIGAAMFSGCIIIYIFLTEKYCFNNTFSKTIIALVLVAILFIFIYLTHHLPVQSYFKVKFGIKLTKVEARYLYPLLGGIVIKHRGNIWYTFNELWDLPYDQRKEFLFLAAAQIIGYPFNEENKGENHE